MIRIPNRNIIEFATSFNFAKVVNVVYECCKYQIIDKAMHNS